MARQERTANAGKNKTCECGATATAAELKAAGHPRTCGTKRAEQQWHEDNREALEKLAAPQKPSRPAARRTKAPQTEAKQKKTALAGARAKPAPAAPSGAYEAAIARDVVRLRDEEKLSWVQIGAKLNLPGSKSGAAVARKLYASTGKDYRGTSAAPRAPKLSDEEREARRKEREERRAAARPTAVKARVRSGEHLIPLDTPDLELFHMLRGKAIGWTIDVSKLRGMGGEPVYSEQEAIVHPEEEFFEVERDEDGGNPYIHFREMHRTSEGPMAAAFRTVRLASIHEVK